MYRIFAHLLMPPLQKLSSTQTPLMGGEGPDIANGDFAGITPRNVVPSTPHALSGAAGHAGLTYSLNAWSIGRCSACAQDSAHHCQTLACIMQVPHRVLVRRQLAVALWRALQQRHVAPLPGHRCAPPVSFLQVGRHGGVTRGSCGTALPRLYGCKGSGKSSACFQVVAVSA
jgi:hypothetical protein